MEDQKEDKPATKDISVFQINDLMRDTYNKIAKWHNDDASKESLKNLSIELIEDIAGAAFSHLGVPYQQGTKIRMDEATKKKVEEERQKLLADNTVITTPEKNTDNGNN